jgi:hypothetical protein
MIRISPPGLARAVGVVAGAGLAILVVIAARPTADFARLPASVSIAVPVTGALEVTPSAPRSVLGSSALTPDGGPTVRTFQIRNQTGRTLHVGFRAKAEARDLDGLLRIRLNAGDRRLSDTTLQGLRQGSQAVRVPSGGTSRIRIEVWIPKDVGDGYVGRQADVSLVPVMKAGA